MKKLLPILTLAAMLAVAGCGFTPVHGQSMRTANAIHLAAVTIEVDNTRRGQFLKAEIQDQTNPATQHVPKQYILKISYRETKTPLFINPDGTSSRGDLQYQSDYTLTRIADGVVVGRGSIQRVSSYNTSQNADYASFVSEEDARQRGIVELAQDYKLRLMNLLPTINDPKAGEVPEAPVAAPSLVPTNSDIYENRRSRL